MKLLNSIAELHAWRVSAPNPVVFVPTMGALHEGHLQLMRDARQMAGEGGSVIVSIFVNPLQFGPNEDFSKYPRELAADAAKCQSVGVDVIFAPRSEEMYPPDRSVTVLESKLSKVLCGASRPGHFDGVCTVVLKLFNLVQPQHAVFGKKDYQQLAIIRRMVRDLNVPVRITGSETVREPDGLAMSSRNRYLTGLERGQAPAVRHALLLAKTRWEAGETSTAALREIFLQELCTEAPLSKVDYIECVDAVSLETPVVASESSLMVAAVFFGKTRLIDNLEFRS